MTITKKRTQTHRNSSWLAAMVMPIAMMAGLVQAGDMADNGGMMDDSTMESGSHSMGMGSAGMGHPPMAADGMAEGKMADDMAGDMGDGMKSSDDGMGDSMAAPMMDDSKTMMGEPANQ
ncbi:hypothetical protein [Marinobacter zhejiangensis]|uniref:Pentapeptide MXKDX repeat protein n=1 Tax=Marinobacter zhejiangensis TaxID=488535 RepID=A0A1I4M598_9GAMM|nr:hypothetical protein [Marinobacter zhejiangensis]SFL98346.1 hypothetical protein SAMN04487963_0857 [Marinobacter zhejiangensis]